MPHRAGLKPIVLAALAILALAATSAGAAASPIGVWLASGETGGKGHVEIYKCGAKLCGKLIWSSNPNALDSRNPDTSKRGRKVVGITMLWGFEPDGENQWDSGRIYDPSSGKTYKCIIRLRGGGKLLHVRGYVGISLIGKTQIWSRVR